MWTAAIVYWVLNALRLTVNIRNVCVLLAPWMASNTAVVTYLFAKELHSSKAGLLAAAFISIVPGLCAILSSVSRLDQNICPWAEQATSLDQWLAHTITRVSPSSL